MAREKIEHRIGVQAPAAVIWGIVSDIEGWRDWNPLYTDAKGQLRFEETLTLTLALPGREPQVIRPTIAEWTPNELIHWRLKMLGGLVRTIRYIEIDTLSETGCIFSNGELFDGMLGPTIARRMERPIRAGFAAMGEAVKARAEAAWRAQADAPTSSGS